MLSILIPTFNYNTFPLVKELESQCKQIEGLHYEIIVNDDSSIHIFENNQIQNLSNCYFYQQKNNQGLSASRNFLITKAAYPWCLFLDDDIWPTSNNFILKYINKIKEQSEICVIFGGLEYSKKKPKSNELLRWLYGNKYEALTFMERSLIKPTHFLSSNLLVSKSILEQFSYPKEIMTYGYEDLIFNLKIIENNFRIFQLENPVFHEKLDTSEIFLSKSKKALDNLSKSIHLGLLPKNATGISKLYYKLNKNGLKRIITFSFKINQKWMEKVLIGSKTNLTLFNIYRLGYFFSINK